MSNFLSAGGGGGQSISLTGGDLGGTALAPTVTSTHITGGTNNVVSKFNATGNQVNSALTDNGTTISSTEPISVPLDGVRSLTLGTGTNNGFSIQTTAASNSVLFKTQDGGQFSNIQLNTLLDSGSLSKLFPLAGTFANLGSLQVITWGSSNAFNATADTSLSRDAAGVIDVGTGAQGNSAGTVKAAVFQTALTNVNINPVTVNANTAGDQNLMAFTVPAGALNTVGRTLSLFAAGVYTTPAANVSTITLKVKLGALTLVSITSSANPGTVTNNSWNLTAYITTQTTGASGALEAHGNMVIDLGASPGLADSTFSDNNAATVSTVDLTASQTLQITIAFSSASGSNASTQRQMVLNSIA